MSNRGKEQERVNLIDYIKEHRSQDEMRDVFLNMDVALKYIHNHNYCIEVFHPSKIEVLDDLPDHIQFDKLVELPQDSEERRKCIQEDIFHSALIQIAFYTNIGDYLKPSFLKEHFDEISIFLPEGDVPYYRGVVQRNASVYYSEYALEKRNRDLQQLNKELGDDKETISQDGEYSNDRINDKIYRQINGDRAFVSFLMLPIIILLGLIAFSLISWIHSFIS